MVDLKLDVPAADTVELDAEALAAIDRGIKDADEGRTVPVDEVRKNDPRVDFQIRITEAALADFEDILAYSWTNFPASAETFGSSILNHVDLLRSFPFIGSPAANRPGVRQLVHTPILIYYRVHEDPNFVEILHFWHGSRGA